MKGLRLFLSPFAPDDSGAASVLHPLGGLVVICDAGGCAGNICGFDEPRWEDAKAPGAVFSAGLRDMDAILGRDDRLMEKLERACRELEPSFAAIIGTPVPAVIATDYSALKRLLARRLDIPIITLDTNGTRLYDEGIGKAYLSLFKTFATSPAPARGGTIGILGATPLDFPPDAPWEKLRRQLLAEDWKEIDIYGMDGGIEPFRQAGSSSRTLVVSASGLTAARYLEHSFGTPFDVFYPFAAEDLRRAIEKSGKLISLDWENILILHDQVHANALRSELRQFLPRSRIVCGTWFQQYEEYAEEQDLHLSEEDEFQMYVRQQDFDCIFGDRDFLRAIPFYRKDFIDLPHFAVSGTRQPPKHENEESW